MILNNESEMISFGSSTFLKGHKKVLLYGELGAGKTHFTKGYGLAMGIDMTKISSPTYTYVNIYDGILLHIDMYRLQTLGELISTGLLEMISNYEHIIIERPKREEQYIDDNRKFIRIQKNDHQSREIFE